MNYVIFKCLSQSPFHSSMQIWNISSKVSMASNYPSICIWKVELILTHVPRAFHKTFKKCGEPRPWFKNNSFRNSMKSHDFININIYQHLQGSLSPNDQKLSHFHQPINCYPNSIVFSLHSWQVHDEASSHFNSFLLKYIQGY